MKKIVLLLAVFFFSFAAFAFDFGGSLGVTEATEAPVDNLSFKQGFETNIWIKANFSKKTSFLTELYYDLEYDFGKEDASAALKQKLDLTSLKVMSNFDVGKNHDKINLSFGRFSVADATGNVFSQKLDAFGFTYKNSSDNSLSFYAGYTGLLNSKTNKVWSNNYTPPNVILYSFAAPYIVGGLVGRFPSLFANQNLLVEAITAVDMDKFTYNRLFMDLSLGGPIYKSFYYSLASSFELIMDGTSSKKVDFSNLSKAELSFFLKKFSAIFSLNAIYVMNNFSPITRKTVACDKTYLDSLDGDTSAFKTGFVASAKFVDPLFLSAGADAVFTVDSTNAISGYKGIQPNVVIRVQPLDDMLIILSYSQLFYKDPSKPSYLVLKGAIRLAF